MTAAPGPNDHQALLLQAALGDDERAVAALGAWDAAVDLDAIDHESFCLLPLLYVNLVDRQLAGSWRHFARVAGIYRQNWYRNQLLLATLREAIDAFSAAGIPTMMLKGAPLALAYYPRPACRQMADVDLLVPCDRAAEAWTVALASGLQPRFPAEFWPPRISASKPFMHRRGWDVDLHVHVMHECLAREADDDLWRAAVPIAIDGSPTATLRAEDHLLHALVHARQAPVPPLRWITDAVMILRRTGAAFDWALFYERAAARELTLHVGLGLRYLSNRFGVDVPAAILARFEQTPPALAERVAAFSRRSSGLTARAASGASDLLRLRSHDAAFRGPLGPVRYLRWAMDLSSSWAVPGRVGRGLMRRARTHFRPVRAQ